MHPTERGKQTGRTLLEQRTPALAKLTTGGSNMVLLKGKTESNVEQPQTEYTGTLPCMTTSIEVESTIGAVVNGCEGESIVVRSMREMPAGFVEISIRGAGDPLTAVVHADSLIHALVCARDRSAE